MQHHPDMKADDGLNLLQAGDAGLVYFLRVLVAIVVGNPGDDFLQNL